MIHKIEQRIAHTLPDDEVWFIYQYIISSGVAIDGQKMLALFHICRPAMKRVLLPAFNYGIQ